jgi:hypothetical protein
LDSTSSMTISSAQSSNNHIEVSDPSSIASASSPSSSDGAPNTPSKWDYLFAMRW